MFTPSDAQKCGKCASQLQQLLVMIIVSSLIKLLHKTDIFSQSRRKQFSQSNGYYRCFIGPRWLFKGLRATASAGRDK